MSQETIVILPNAEADLAGLSAFYSRRQRLLFLADLAGKLALIEQSPLENRQHERIPSIRCCPVAPTALLYYRHKPGVVEVVAVKYGRLGFPL